MSLEDLQHPDCRACEERKRLNLGLLAENQSLRSKLAEQVRADLHADDTDRSLAGPLAEAIATAAGSYSLEFVTPEQLAAGIAAWLREAAA